MDSLEQSPTPPWYYCPMRRNTHNFINRALFYIYDALLRKVCTQVRKTTVLTKLGPLSSMKHDDTLVWLLEHKISSPRCAKHIWASKEFLKLWTLNTHSVLQVRVCQPTVRKTPVARVRFLFDRGSFYSLFRSHFINLVL